MNLISETLIISGTMFILCLVPHVSASARKYSRYFFLVGTGALTGLLIFDLFPDAVSMGGRSSLLTIAAVWICYSLLHIFHIGHHHPSNQIRQHEMEISPAFIGSMMAHCLASGMFLALSASPGDKFHKTVFFALLAHKCYEALTYSTMVFKRGRSKVSSFSMIGLYVLSLPAGVAVAIVGRDHITQKIALVATSFAIGTLLGCLMFDFLLPSLRQLKGKQRDFGWIVMGLLVTQLMMRLV